MFKFIALTVILPALLGPIAALTTTDSAIAAKPTKQGARNKAFGPWRASIQSLSNAGRTIKHSYDDEKTVEAAGQWIVATVRIQNISAARKSAKGVFYLMGSKIVANNNQEYKADPDANNSLSLDELLETRPLNPGEARDIQLVFDMPTNARIQRLDLSAMKSMADLKVYPGE